MLCGITLHVGVIGDDAAGRVSPLSRGGGVGVFFLSFVIVYICWLSASAVAQLDGQWLTIVHTVWAASHLNGVLFNNVLVCHVGA